MSLNSSNVIEEINFDPTNLVCCVFVYLQASQKEETYSEQVRVLIAKHKEVISNKVIYHKCKLELCIYTLYISLNAFITTQSVGGNYKIFCFDHYTQKLSQ